MPAQVVVVKRTRRRIFDSFLRVPSLLRALAGGVLSRGRASSARASSFDAAHRSNEDPTHGFGSGVPRLRRVGAAPSEPTGDPGSAHRCVACGVCVAICPSRCLRVEAADGADEPALFTLDVGSCIRCGVCAEDCPESALELVDVDAAWIGDSPAAPGRRHDLLDDVAAGGRT